MWGKFYVPARGTLKSVPYGYITVSDAGFITLTDKGHEIADMIYERHTFLSDAQALRRRTGRTI